MNRRSYSSFVERLLPDSTNMLSKIDHIGIAVHSIAEARVFYEQALGLHCERIEEVASQQVRTAFFSLGETHIELLEPMGQNGQEGPVAKFLAERGEGIHHIAYQSDNVSVQLDRAEKFGCRLINKKPVSGAGGRQIGFLHPKSTHGVLTEICSTQELQETQE